MASIFTPNDGTENEWMTSCEVTSTSITLPTGTTIS